MFIQTEPMPDAEQLKFLPGRSVLGDGRLQIEGRAQAAASPLAQRLFDVPGVSGVVLGSDFIVVAKDDGDWQHMKPAILGVIMEHFMSGAPVVDIAKPGGAVESPAVTGGAPGLAERIRAALRQVIDPELGYNIVDLGLVYQIAITEGGVVEVTMSTTTPGCPATDYLKSGAGESAGSVPGVEIVDVKLTYEPRWTPDRMSPEAKAHFGIRDGDRW